MLLFPLPTTARSHSSLHSEDTLSRNLVLALESHGRHAPALQPSSPCSTRGTTHTPIWSSLGYLCPSPLVLPQQQVPGLSNQVCSARSPCRPQTQRQERALPKTPALLPTPAPPPCHARKKWRLLRQKSRGYSHREGQALGLARSACKSVCKSYANLGPALGFLAPCHRCCLWLTPFRHLGPG